MTRSSPPTERGLPLVGHTLSFARDARALMTRMQAKHGDVFGVRVLGIPTTVFATPDATKTVYLNRDRAFSSELGWEPTIGLLFRHGLMLRDFDDHRLHRSVMQQAFRKAALAGYLSTLGDVVDAHLQGLPTGEPVDLYDVVKHMTLDIAAAVFLGVELGTQSRSVNRAFVTMMRGAVSPVRRPLPGSALRRGLSARSELERIIGDLISDRRRAPEGADLLSRLCHAVDDAGQPLSDRDVIDHMIFLLLAAHDTTSSSLSVMLWEVAHHEVWQDRVIDEVSRLDGERLDMTNQAELESTELVFKEAMRLHPPVPFSPRVAIKDTTVDGWEIREGTMLTLSSLLMHRSREYWRHPDRFDPERFAKGREEHRSHSHVYVPFGGGAHTCLGNHFAELMVKAIISQLFAHHRIEAPRGTTLRMDAVPIPKPRHGLALTVK